MNGTAFPRYQRVQAFHLLHGVAFGQSTEAQSCYVPPSVNYWPSGTVGPQRWLQAKQSSSLSTVMAWTLQIYLTWPQVTQKYCFFVQFRYIRTFSKLHKSILNMEACV